MSCRTLADLLVKVFYFLTAVFFLIAAVWSNADPTNAVSAPLYIVCAICFLLGALVDLGYYLGTTQWFGDAMATTMNDLTTMHGV